MLQKLKSIWIPGGFHGSIPKAPFFEGWYYRFTDAEQRHTVAVIPGLYRSPERKEHAFIMYLNGPSLRSEYITIARENFRASRNAHHLTIGSNTFNDKQVQLGLKCIHGSLQFSQLTPWPVSLFSPGAMGRFAFVPFMQCYHAVLSFSHQLTGFLSIDGQSINFNNGQGYIEKDWGTGFPRSYIWIQAQHFSKADCSLMLSIAHIPWLKRYFPGFLIGLRCNDRFYSFTTYNGAVLKKCRVTGKTIEICAQNNTCEIEIKAMRQTGATLHAPVHDRMHPAVQESLTTPISLILRDKKSILLETQDKLGGLDVYGDTSCLLKEKDY